MNERIKDLAAQAGILCKPRALWDDNEPDGYLVSDIEHASNNWQAVRAFFEDGLDKFAELIIKECAIVVDSKTEDTGSGVAAGWCEGSDLLKHFGIKE